MFILSRLHPLGWISIRGLDKPARWTQSSQPACCAGRGSVRVLVCSCGQISFPGWHWGAWGAVAGSSLRDTVAWRVPLLQEKGRKGASVYEGLKYSYLLDPSCPLCVMEAKIKKKKAEQAAHVIMWSCYTKGKASVALSCTIFHILREDLRYESWRTHGKKHVIAQGMQVLI